MSIQRLPGEVAAQIRSSTIVTSLNDTGIGLLKNALDADARKVNITVDYARGGCTVIDDGSGIASYEYPPEGGLGKRHHTSKYPSSPEKYGRNGLFLASVGALSLLTVTSRCQGQDSRDSLTMHNGKHLRRLESESENVSLGLVPHGTSVSVRDLFGCMPVRARMRPVLGSAEWARAWDSLVRTVTALLLAYPKDVTVTIKDDHNNCKKTLRAEKSDAGRAGIARTARLLAQAGYTDAADAESWVDVEASVPGVSLAGCISFTPVASKKTQFICIGIEPLTDDTLSSLYDNINKLFAESNFGAAQKTSKGPIDRFTREMKPRKGVDRWPMFSICVDLKDSVEVEDVLNDQRQYLSIIKHLLQVMVSEFLAEHGFYKEPRGLYQEKLFTASTSSADSSTKKQKTANSHILPCRGKSMSSTSLFLSWPQTKRSARPQKKVADDRSEVVSQSQEVSQSQKEEKSRFFADPCSHSDSVDAEECAEHTATHCLDQNTLVSGELKISRTGLEAARVIGQVDQKFILLSVPAFREADDSSSSIRKGETILVLVDQHAADERIRVEALLRDYFIPSPTPSVLTANMNVLSKPLNFELLAHELSILHRSRGYFRHWGIFYDVLSSDSAPYLRVDRLPLSIAERCTQEPRLVVDMLRSELSKLPANSDTVPSANEGLSWIARLNGCPRGIIDLVNSKACRSAIKFNDPLTREECVDLLDRLLECSFPFQCAHGRPSMVPVLDIG